MAYDASDPEDPKLLRNLVNMTHLIDLYWNVNINKNYQVGNDVYNLTAYLSPTSCKNINES